MGALQDKSEAELELEKEAFVHRQLLAGLPGGSSLISQLQGYVPEFGDAVMEEICLSTAGTSHVRFWLGGAGLSKDAKNLIVTFEIRQVLDMSLDFFRANVMFELLLSRPIIRPERTNYLDAFADDDLEFKFHSSWGMDGFLVARGVSLHWRPE